MTLKNFIWILTILLTLSGCSTTKTTSTAAEPTSAKPTANWPTREAELNQIRNWHISGKIAVQSARDSGSASVDWYQNVNRYNISLSGPLGASAMKLSGSQGQVTLQTSDGKSYRASSPEQLLKAQWGFNLPVSSMNYWIRGLPVPGIAADRRFDSRGRLVTLIQQGNRIDYLSYSNTGRVELPERISIVSPSLRVKMIVYSWNVG